MQSSLSLFSSFIEDDLVVDEKSYTSELYKKIKVSKLYIIMLYILILIYTTYK